VQLLKSSRPDLPSGRLTLAVGANSPVQTGTLIARGAASDLADLPGASDAFMAGVCMASLVGPLRGATLLSAAVSAPACAWAGKASVAIMPVAAIAHNSWLRPM